MIKINDVSLCYRMPTEPVSGLKEFIVTLLKGKMKFKEFWALKNLSFEVRKGEVLGVIGHNGAGKSTLLKVISGILNPTTGKVKVEGNVVPMLELGSGFDYELTGCENIFLNGSILGYSEEFLKEKYDEIVEFSELGEFIDVPLRSYSSGMVMRLAFSVATVVKPDILIVDEILSVGDADFQMKSQKRMLELMSGGTTVLLVSHSIKQISDLCDRVIWLEHGEVIMIGSTEDVCVEYLGGNKGSEPIWNMKKVYEHMQKRDYEFSMVFFDTGNGFNASDVTWYKYVPDDGRFNFKFKFPVPCCRFRFDPVWYGGYEMSKLSIDSGGSSPKVNVLIGEYEDGKYDFPDTDPQLELLFDEEVKEINIEYELRQTREVIIP